ncbi:hypothetical protein [Enterobacter hormaechei]|uniref:hypothetical protein n=1 Tax=Enterobacter hormaechei TaxID=158836 RepID=UPI001696E23E|nr:hypothetical protein [Enterobacter hormaechei]EFJ2552625.1 hypothetical protein [Escherichia coli]ELY4419311.1 hypothetical protein [Cronobacter sakazakii]EFO2013715.1 hypothetical protein [Escherichia coli]EHS0471965.1 hypothetical protein [Escherichia coli]WNJ35689.1 hypothetical protein RMN59_04795 [Enterobacter hormaechei subsp. hormaechei]
MIEEITQQRHFKERIEYVEYLFEQALSLEQENNFEEIDHLIDVLATEAAPFLAGIQAIRGIKERMQDA